MDKQELGVGLAALALAYFAHWTPPGLAGGFMCAAIAIGASKAFVMLKKASRE